MNFQIVNLHSNTKCIVIQFLCVLLIINLIIAMLFFMDTIDIEAIANDCWMIDIQLYIQSYNNSLK